MNLKFRISDYTMLSLIVVISILQTYLYNQIIYGSCSKLYGHLYYLIIGLYAIALLFGILVCGISIRRNKARAVLYLTFSFAMFFFFFVRYRTDYARHIKRAWARKNMIVKIGDCCVSYINETNLFKPENIKWRKGFASYIDSDTKNRLSNLELSLYSLNSHPSNGNTFLPVKGNIILFEKPSDSSQTVGDVSEIKLSTKRYLFLYSDNHLVYRYIPHKNKLFLEKATGGRGDLD